MRCDECKFWAEGSTRLLAILEKTHGLCSALPGEKVDITIEAGWNGGVVGEIETDADFFCGYFEAKGKEGGSKK